MGSEFKASAAETDAAWARTFFRPLAGQPDKICCPLGHILSAPGPNASGRLKCHLLNSTACGWLKTKEAKESRVLAVQTAVAAERAKDAVTLKDLLQAGCIREGDQLTSKWSQTAAGTLTADGTIKYKENIFKKPGRFASCIKEEATGMRVTQVLSGWGVIACNGKLLRDIRDAYLSSLPTEMASKPKATPGPDTSTLVKVKLLDLLQSGLIQVGGKVSPTFNMSATGTITATGCIAYKQKVFQSLTAFASYIQEEKTGLKVEARKSISGWSIVYYNGKLLKKYKDIFLKSRRSTAAPALIAEQSSKASSAIVASRNGDNSLSKTKAIKRKRASEPAMQSNLEKTRAHNSVQVQLPQTAQAKSRSAVKVQRNGEPDQSRESLHLHRPRAVLTKSTEPAGSSWSKCRRDKETDKQRICTGAELWSSSQSIQQAEKPVSKPEQLETNQELAIVPITDFGSSLEDTAVDFLSEEDEVSLGSILDGNGIESPSRFLDEEDLSTEIPDGSYVFSCTNCRCIITDSTALVASFISHEMLIFSDATSFLDEGEPRPLPYPACDARDLTCKCCNAPLGLKFGQTKSPHDIIRDCYGLKIASLTSHCLGQLANRRVQAKQDLLGLSPSQKDKDVTSDKSSEDIILALEAPPQAEAIKSAATSSQREQQLLGEIEELRRMSQVHTLALKTAGLLPGP